MKESISNQEDLLRRHIHNRNEIVAALREELLGPSPAGPEFDVRRNEPFSNVKDWWGPFRQKGSGEEILTRDTPIKRYGLGVLFPWETELDEPSDVNGNMDGAAAEIGDSDRQQTWEADVSTDYAVPETEVPDDDFDVSMANAYQPSSIAVSFLAHLEPGSRLLIKATGGRYARHQVAAIEGNVRKSRNWWLRIPIELEAEFPAERLLQPQRCSVQARLQPRSQDIQLLTESLIGDLDLRIEVLSRPHGMSRRLLTICLVNRTLAPPHEERSQYCLFQSWFSATLSSPSGAPAILPYPSLAPSDNLEQLGLEMLYRDVPTFATGHGCAADWDEIPGSLTCKTVRAECLPIAVTPAVTQDIIRKEDGTPLRMSMGDLARLEVDDQAWNGLVELVDRYAAWIDRQRDLASSSEFPRRFRTAAEHNLEQCESALKRMRRGLNYLSTSESALEAFRLANHAILLQQLATRESARKVNYDPDARVLRIEGTHTPPNIATSSSDRGKWWAFQIAFLLQSIESTAEGNHPDRDIVDLIWFPTGGGKTEAYLGLAAFAMFKRRLDDPSDVGVHTLMRYTLRLLTTQQFERASGLICAMEVIRAENADRLGSTPFSIGIWLGSATTPNTREQAIAEYREFKRNPRKENPFLMSKCPWCGAAFGRIQTPRQKRGVGIVTGFVDHVDPATGQMTVRLNCPDPSCHFHDHVLPIYLVDEDIYQYRPSLVIGTVDKFAMLAWKPEARSLFGIGIDGRRISSPPGLIIQDELHLISGPLGSMAGLYEATIHELCVDNRQELYVVPKIVASTATIRNYQEQVHGLYDRSRASLFPPPGLDAKDSFFAVQDKELPGRMYIGVHATSLGSVQTEWVRVFSALLQAPMRMEAADRDPWWTLLTFFNSIREMGTAHTLIESDVRDYLEVIWKRNGIAADQRRYLARSPRELTGGLKRSEIIGAIDDLKIEVHDGRRAAIDVCLASNIIEVGIDIPRLSLMVVAGQPKSTSQYIQVTGRVGRRKTHPGLVVVMYSPSKPRDRSHYERFRSYHDHLYANVEPTSVTPFSAPALERALHAVLVAFIRQIGDQQVADSPWPIPEQLVARFKSFVENRVSNIDPSEIPTFSETLERRIREWRSFHPSRWSSTRSDGGTPLLRAAGEYIDPDHAFLSWPTPMSMRNVDATCEVAVTTRYVENPEVDWDA